MEKKFGTISEQYLNGVIVVADSDGILYHESAKTNKLSAKDAVNCFVKGFLVINDGTNMIRPTGITVGDSYVTLFYTSVGASDKAVKTCFYSDGYTPAQG